MKIKATILLDLESVQVIFLSGLVPSVSAVQSSTIALE